MLYLQTVHVCSGSELVCLSSFITFIDSFHKLFFSQYYGNGSRSYAEQPEMFSRTSPDV